MKQERRANKVVVLLAVLICMLLSSCGGKNIYHEGTFFPVDFLKEELILNLPVPEGDLLYIEKNGFSSARVCVSGGENAEEYAQKVLDFLRGYSPDYLYTVADFYQYYNLVTTKEHAYVVKEFESLDECFFEKSNIDSWFFVFGYNMEHYINEDGTAFLKDESMIRIYKKSPMGDALEYNGKKYDWAIIINDDPCNVLSEGK